MKVLAIDPGYDRIGIAVIERLNQEETLLYSECLETNRKDELPDRLLEIGQNLEKIIVEHKPEMVAIETLFFNKNISTAIGVAAARGVVFYLARKNNCVVHEYSPQAIKVATTGYGNSDKAAVIMMVKKLIRNAPLSALDDEYDAIAIGITCLAHNR